MDITRHIENLNQRGGRMLTACDLTAAGTLDIQLQAYLMHAVRRGASIITCAGPGGTGKTTLLGALLTFLPPASRLVVVDSAAPPAWYQKEAKGIGPVWFLCHELGRGPYYSYLWGQNAKTFLEAPAGIPGCYIATTAHADTLEELQDLFRRHLNTAIPAAGGPDCLILFMAAFPLPRPLPTAGLGQRWRRVVTSIYHLSSSGRQGEDR
ncbi:MAG TPA: Flp pilus assembly complex ATPase component TadA, partial [Firmicutes bacterium]|nr:Flp pilus assembly complex ATPase component TadA [Bacillota bacterium]